jgi:hypothetical protein
MRIGFADITNFQMEEHVVFLVNLRNEIDCLRI